MKTLRVGCVKYLNARPLIRGWDGAVEFDHPSALCQRLARGELDIALVSSIEYLRRPQYRIVDHVSLSADGPVYSVIVAHEQELSSVEQIQIDPASETSVALLRCLLRERGLNPLLLEGDAPPTPRSAGARRSTSSAQLLIGDQAIRFRQTHPTYRVWDLAEEWKKLTGLPFVFALWLVRPEVRNASEVANRLRKLRDRNLQSIDELIAEQGDFDPEFCRRYFRHYLHFDFGEGEKAGLREFHRRCLACGIEIAPKLEINIV